MIVVRQERAGEESAIREVHCSAFPSALEAELVDALRRGGNAVISRVAEVDGTIVGHVVFSPVTVVGGGAAARGLGLAPLAVVPALQRRGVGSLLVREGIRACRESGWAFVVVLGAPAYYERFGFERASRLGLGNEYGVDDEFMVVELAPGSLRGARGVVVYGPEFGRFAATAP